MDEITKLIKLKAKPNDDSACAILAMIRASYDHLENEKQEFLHSDELNQLNQYSHDRKRLSYMLGRLALKQALTNYFDKKKLSKTQILIENSDLGVPYISNFSINLSLSHTGEWAVACVSPMRCKLTVDLELIDNFSKIDDCFFSKCLNIVLSKTNIQSIPAIKSIIWTAKESLAKFLGISFLLDLTILEISDIDCFNNFVVCKFKNFPANFSIVFLCKKFAFSLCCAGNYKPNARDIAFQHLCCFLDDSLSESENEVLLI